MTRRLIVFLLALLVLLPMRVAGAAAVGTNASFINVGTSIQAVLTSSKGENWYQIITDKDGDVRITLENATAPLYLGFYDNAGNRLDYTYCSNQNNAGLSESVKKGSYFIKVSADGWGDKYTSGGYTLKATYAKDNVKQDTSTFKPNETKEMGYLIQSGIEYSSKVTSDVDVDFYKITTDKDGDIRVTLVNTTASLYLGLYDSVGNRIDYTNASAQKNAGLLQTEKKGTYYIKVTADSWGGKYTEGAYTIKATYSSETLKQDNTTYEPNDTINTAYFVESGVPYTSKISSDVDFDWYKITLGKDGDILVLLDNSTASLYLGLYDDAGSRLDYTNCSPQNNAKLTKSVKKGIYYIKISADGWGNKYTDGMYTLKTFYPSGKSSIKLQVGSNIATVNGVNQKLDAAPTIVDGRTLVPVRFISEALGATVGWDGSERRITISMGKDVITLWVDKSESKVNGNIVYMDVPPQMIDERTMVPLRFIGENFNKKISFDNDSFVITITES